MDQVEEEIGKQGELAAHKNRPYGIDHLRVAHIGCVSSSSVVSPYYDPMIGKIVCHGTDRDTPQPFCIDDRKSAPALGALFP